MSESKIVKDRKCSKCKAVIATDAKGIKQHASVCK